MSYDFTARVEDDLDRIALGKADRVAFLNSFYFGETGLRARLDQALAAETAELYKLPSPAMRSRTCTCAWASTAPS